MIRVIDRYILWENLLYLLGEHRAQSPIYIGRHIPTLIPRGYESGGAGYVISKPAVRKIVDEGTKYPAACSKDGAYEDHDIGRSFMFFAHFSFYF